MRVTYGQLSRVAKGANDKNIAWAFWERGAKRMQDGLRLPIMFSLHGSLESYKMDRDDNRKPKIFHEKSKTITVKVWDQISG